MRRWLQLGAASAGMGAALLGLSALSPDLGVATAETTGQSTVSSSASDSDESGTSNDTGSSEAAGDTDAADRDDEDDAAEDDPAEDDAEDPDEEDAQDEPRPAQRTARDRTGPVAPMETPDTTDDEPAAVTREDAAGRAAAEPVAAPPVSDPADADHPAAPAPSQPWALQASSTVGERQQQVAGQIAALMASSQSFIASLPVSTPVREALTGTVFTVQRAFLNQAPTIQSVVQFTGQSGEPVGGRLGAVDPEGDGMVYRVVQGPKAGTLQLNPDGSYTYTPGADFAGVETFVIAAYDRGLHVNLLDLFRNPGTSAAMLVNQGAIRFAFDYTTGAEHWTAERRAALESVATSVGTYFFVTAPVTLTYDVTGLDNPDTQILATAGSNLVGNADEFLRSVIQVKVVTGVDANGAAADGVINWNFAYPWALGAPVGPDSLDFRTVAVHELMHSFGFLSRIDSPGNNDHRYWSVFDAHVAAPDGTKVISSDFTWNSAYDGNINGHNGGLYFAGPNAVAAYGGLVPLFTSDPWSASSVVHLAESASAPGRAILMLPWLEYGPGVRVLSPVELGILKDLGYTVLLHPMPV